MRCDCCMGWLGDPVPDQVDPNWQHSCMSVSGAYTGAIGDGRQLDSQNSPVARRICCNTVVAALAMGCRLFASASVSAIRSGVRSMSPRAAMSSSIELLLACVVC